MSESVKYTLGGGDGRSLLNLADKKYISYTDVNVGTGEVYVQLIPNMLRYACEVGCTELDIFVELFNGIGNALTQIDNATLTKTWERGIPLIEMLMSVLFSTTGLESERGVFLLKNPMDGDCVDPHIHEGALVSSRESVPAWALTFDVASLKRKFVKIPQIRGSIKDQSSELREHLMGSGVTLSIPDNVNYPGIEGGHNALKYNGATVPYFSR